MLGMEGKSKCKPCLISANRKYLPKAKTELGKESLHSGNWNQVELPALEVLFWGDRRPGVIPVRIRAWITLKGPTIGTTQEKSLKTVQNIKFYSCRQHEVWEEQSHQSPSPLSFHINT